MRSGWLVGLFGMVALSSVARAQPSAPVPDVTTAPSSPPPVATAPGLTPPSGVPMVAPSLGANLGVATAGTLPADRYYSPYAAYPPPGDELVYEPSYRAVLALADLGSVGLMFSGSNAGLLGGLAAYTFLAPTIHLAHDEGLRAAGSFGLRFGAPMLGALIGYALLGPLTKTGCGGGYDDCDDSDGRVTGALLGAIAGMVAAMVIDDVVIARPRLTHKHSSLVVAPRVNVTPQQTTVGLAGSF
jgi:hypothetical protein